MEFLTRGGEAWSSSSEVRRFSSEEVRHGVSQAR